MLRQMRLPHGEKQSLHVFELRRPLVTVVLQFLVGPLDGGALPGQKAEALLRLPQLVQVAVLGLALQRQLLPLREESSQREVSAPYGAQMMKLRTDG